MKQQYNIGVVDSAGEMDADGNLAVYYERRPSSSRVLYRVNIRLVGMDLPYVASATYQLPSSFRERMHRVDRTISNPNCALTIWTSGVFTVRVIITLKSRQNIFIDFRLRYGDAMRAHKQAGTLQFRDVGTVNPGVGTLPLAATSPGRQLAK